MMGTTKIALGIIGGLLMPIIVGCTVTTQPAPAPAPPSTLPAPEIPSQQPGQPDPESTQKPSPPNQQNTSANVKFLQDIFNSMDTQQRTRIQNGWRNVKGDDKLEEIFLEEFTKTINENGTVQDTTGEPLTVEESRQFMDWTLLQQA